MVKWLLALWPTLAFANSIATDAPPPAPAIAVEETKPSKPLERWLGARFGVMNGALDGHERSFIVIDVQWSVTVTPRIHLLADYDWLIVTGDEGLEMPEVRGRGHGLRAGGRLTVLDATFQDDGKVYADVETSGGIAYISDNYVGPQWVPSVLVGARLGYELWKRDPSSLSAKFGANLLMGALRSPGDTGFTFQIGVEWAQ